PRRRGLISRGATGKPASRPGGKRGGRRASFILSEPDGNSHRRTSPRPCNPGPEFAEERWKSGIGGGQSGRGPAHHPHRGVQYLALDPRHWTQLRTGRQLLCQQARKSEGLPCRGAVDRTILVRFRESATKGTINNGTRTCQHFAD